MLDTTSTALRVALDYHEAWTSRDVERAMTFIADDIICDAPAGRIEGAAAYRAFIGPFMEILLSAQLIATFGDDETALVMYDTETVLVTSAPGAECLTIRDGKIVQSRFVFDHLPFAEARAGS